MKQIIKIIKLIGSQVIQIISMSNKAKIPHSIREDYRRRNDHGKS
jgi:hypothetical protein